MICGTKSEETRPILRDIMRLFTWSRFVFLKESVIGKTKQLGDILVCGSVFCVSGMDVGGGIEAG